MWQNYNIIRDISYNAKYSTPATCVALEHEIYPQVIDHMQNDTLELLPFRLVSEVGVAINKSFVGNFSNDEDEATVYMSENGQWLLFAGKLKMEELATITDCADGLWSVYAAGDLSTASRNAFK